MLKKTYKNWILQMLKIPIKAVANKSYLRKWLKLQPQQAARKLHHDQEKLLIATKIQSGDRKGERQEELAEKAEQEEK